MRRLQALFFSLLIVCTIVFPETPANLTAMVRSGQVFLTWSEVTGANQYIIYSSTSPITAGYLTSGNVRIKVLQGSAGNKQLELYTGAGSFFDTYGCIPLPDFSRNVITPLNPSTSGLATEVPAGTGMMVFTTHTSGNYYYAVTAVTGGVEDKTLNNGNNIGPIAETVADPEPVLIWQSDTMCARLYLQYTDVDSFNPTQAGTYAWPYWVGVKKNYNSTTDRGNLHLKLDGYSGLIRGWNYAIYNNNGISVNPHENGNWWFGWSKTFTYDTSKAAYGASDAAVTTGPVYNFVQARIMAFFKWMIYVEPYYASRIDTNWITVEGGSMGGGGTLMMIQNYPDFFASGQAKVPPTNYLETGWTWYTNCRASWGTGDNDNIKVHFTGWRSEWAETRFGGMACHQWLNLENFYIPNTEDVELPYLGICSGGQDGSVNWPQQGRNYYNGLEATRRGWSGQLSGASGHFCEGDGNWMLSDKAIRKNEAFPAFNNTRKSMLLPLPEEPLDSNYTMNRHFIWAVEHYQVGGVFGHTDETNRFDMVIASYRAGYEPMIGDDTADVTLRRLQRFAATPYADYHYKNTTVHDTTVIYQSGTMTADSFGLITIPNLYVRAGSRDTGGCRLIVAPDIPVTESEAAPCGFRNAWIEAVPNPFNPTTSITVIGTRNTIANRQSMHIYDFRGRLIEILLPVANSGHQGWVHFLWNAGKNPSGLYIARIYLDGRTLSKKLLLQK